MIRLLLSDDHPVVRAGIRALLESTDLEVVAEAATAEEPCASPRHHVDLVLDGPAVPAARSRVLRRPAGSARGRRRPRVLVLTNYDTDADILGARSRPGRAGTC